MTGHEWPVAEFDPVRRLRVVAATTAGVTIRETVLAAPWESVWAVAADLEEELPHWLFADIRSVRVSATSDPDRRVALALGHSRLRARFDVVLRPGWCLMQSRFLIGGMAAIDENGGTRFALLAGMRGPFQSLAALTRPVSARLSDRALRRLAERVAHRPS